MSSKSQVRNLFVAGLFLWLASGKVFAIGVPLQTHEGFLTTEYQTVFTNLKLDDIQTFSATLMGNHINSGSPHGLVTLGHYYQRPSADEMTMIFAANSKTIIRGVQVRFHQNGNDIEAKLEKSLHNNGSTTYETSAHTTADVTGGWNPGTWFATSLTEGGHGVGRLTAYGKGSDRVVFPPNATKSSQVFAPGASLASLRDWYAFMAGSSMSAQAGWSQTYEASDGLACVQFGARDGTYLKGISVSLAADGESLSLIGVCQNYTSYGVGSFGKRITSNQSAAFAETDRAGGYSARAISAAVSPLAYSAYSVGQFTTEEKLVWENLALSDVLAFEGVTKGQWIAPGNAYAACHVRNDGTEASVQFQLQDGPLKCLKLTFTQKGSDVWGRAVYIDNRAGTAVGYDFDQNATHTPAFAANGYDIQALRVVCMPAGWKVWTGRGGDGKFSTGANWRDGIAPTAGDKVLLTGSDAAQPIENDLDEGMSLAALAYVGSGDLTLTGNSVVLGKVANYSTYGTFRIEAPVSAVDLSPYAESGIAFRTLNVSGTLAPQGRAQVDVLESAQIGRLCLGDSHVIRDLSDFAGRGPALLHTLGGAGVKQITSFDSLAWRMGGFRFEGTNTFASSVRTSQSTVLSIGKGVTTIPTLNAWDADYGVTIDPDGELRLGAIDKSNETLNFSVTVSGMLNRPGRLACSAGTLALGTWFKGVGTRLATAGQDLTITGAMNVDADAAGNDTLWLDATDSDGKVRTMTFSAVVSGNGKLGICGGTVRLSSKPGVPLTVAQGGVLAADADIDASGVTLAGGALDCASTGVLDFGATFDAADLLVRRADGKGEKILLVADSIVNVPRRVNDVNGGKWPCKVVHENGRDYLVIEDKHGLLLLFR